MKIMKNKHMAKLITLWRGELQALAVCAHTVSDLVSGLPSDLNYFDQIDVYQQLTFT